MNVLPTKPAGDTSDNGHDPSQHRRKTQAAAQAQKPAAEAPIELKEPFSITVHVDAGRGVVFRIVDGTSGEVVREVSPAELRSVGKQIVQYLDLRKQRFHHEVDQRG